MFETLIYISDKKIRKKTIVGAPLSKTNDCRPINLLVSISCNESSHNQMYLAPYTEQILGNILEKLLLILIIRWEFFGELKRLYSLLILIAWARVYNERQVLEFLWVEKPVWSFKSFLHILLSKILENYRKHPNLVRIKK